jgi:spore coat polysaccharide biosynthesis protein SpsF
MAKKFLSLIPQHQMIKFTKNGSTATSAAVKLARAKTNRKLIAFPSDQPFFSYDDWFIGKTPCNKGVPDEISNLSVTFKSCDIEDLDKLFKKYPDQIAGVIMEPERITCSSCNCKISISDYLQRSIELTQSNGAVFILDEMVTGFKIDLPGAISRYRLEPDIATWGKGIANGFSFCALTGKKEIMELGGISQIGNEKVFLTSTTHGGETHAIRAALKTIEIFQEQDVIDHNHSIGSQLIEEATLMIEKVDLQNSIQVIPCNWIVGFVFKNKEGNDCAFHRTYFLQEMINEGILFQGVFIPCFSHKNEELEYFLNGFRNALSNYKNAFEDGIQKHLLGDITKPVFRKIL